MSFFKRRWPLIVLAALLAVSLAANVLIFRHATKTHRQLNALRLDPIGAAVFPSNDPPPRNPSIMRVVFFGDSRAAMWPAPASKAFSGFEFFNRGIGEQTTAQSLERFERHVAPLQPDVVVIQVGVNDLKTIPLFPERKNEIIADCKRNIDELVGRARGLDAHIILTTVFPLGEVPLSRRPFWSSDVAAAVAEVNDHIRAQSAYNGVHILNATPILAGPDGVVRLEYSADLLHLKPAGYASLEAELTRLIRLPPWEHE